MLTLSTTNKFSATGAPQILAKGNGRQVTVKVDQTKSQDWNHGTAAGTLALKLGLTSADATSNMSHAVNDKGVHFFSIG
jgi:hypothetical protein